MAEELGDSLKGISTDLEKVLRQLSQALTTVEKLNKATGKTGENLKAATKEGSKGNGNSGKRQTLGTDGASFSTEQISNKSANIMETALSTVKTTTTMNPNNGKSMLGPAVAFGAGMATAAGIGMPDVGMTIARAGGYYNAGIMTGGVNRKVMEQATFSGLGGGLTSRGSDAAVSAILTGRGMGFSSNYGSTYQQTLRSVGNAAKYLNMPNEVAAQAVEGLTSGSMSGNLMRTMGIATSDPRTGKVLTQGQIFEQMAGRLTAGRGKASVVDTQESLRRGNLGEFIKNSGLDPAQQALFAQYMIEQAKGNNMDLSSNKDMKSLMQKAKEEGNANPFAAMQKITASDTKTMGKAEDAYIGGMEAAATTIEKVLNPALGELAASVGGVNAYFQTLGGTNAGQAGMTATGAVATLGSHFLMYKGIKSIFNKNSIKAAGTKGSKFLSEGAKTVGKAGKFAKVAGLGQILWAGGQVGNPFKSFNPNYELDETQGILDSMLHGPRYVPKDGGGDASAVGTGGSSASPAPGFVAPTTAALGTPYGASGSLWKGGIHKGNDYPMPDGSNVNAAADGTVSAKQRGGSNGKLGMHIIIDHGGGYETVYGHLSQKLVSAGTTVKQGQLIAKSGHSGHTTGPHLHFEVNLNGVAIDPNQLINATSGKPTPGGDNKAPKVTDVLKIVMGGGAGGFDLSNNLVKISNSGISGNMMSTSGLVAAGSPSFVMSSLRTGATPNPVPGASPTPSGTPSANAGNDLWMAIKAAGFTGNAAKTAWAIAMAESNGRPNAYNPKGMDDSWGAFQINMKNDDPRNPNMGIKRLKQFGLTSNEQLLDLYTNARAAWMVSEQGTAWGKWTTYGGSRYKKFLAGAPSASSGIDYVKNDTPVNVHKGEAVLTATEAQAWRDQQNNPSLYAGKGEATTVNITVNPSAGMNERMLAEHIRNVFQDIKREDTMMGA
jgi:murein DD-endopeptidase MepM/ murein hydrolase activator NlpD